MHEKHPAATGLVGLCMPDVANQRRNFDDWAEVAEWTLIADQAVSRLSHCTLHLMISRLR